MADPRGGGGGDNPPLRVFCFLFVGRPTCVGPSKNIYLTFKVQVIHLSGGGIGLGPIYIL